MNLLGIYANIGSGFAILHHNNHALMSIISKDYKRNFTGSGMEDLQHFVLALAQEKHPSSVTLQLTCSSKRNMLGSWNLKQVIEEPHLD